MPKFFLFCNDRVGYFRSLWQQVLLFNAHIRQIHEGSAYERKRYGIQSVKSIRLGFHKRKNQTPCCPVCCAVFMPCVTRRTALGQSHLKEPKLALDDMSMMDICAKQTEQCGKRKKALDMLLLPQKDPMTSPPNSNVRPKIASTYHKRIGRNLHGAPTTARHRDHQKAASRPEISKE